MKVHKPKSIKEAIDNLQTHLEYDLYSKFRPDKDINGEIWTREDSFEEEKEFQEYLQEHFDILRKEIRRLKK